ncbi:hypothetical protein ACXYMU_00425 [Pontibacter sp. CAU 1760]
MPNPETEIRHFRYTTWYLFLGLTALFIALYALARELYRHVLQEDQLVEWITFLGLIVTSTVALLAAVAIYRKFAYLHWFFVLFSLFSLLAGLEEISWGQRIFGWETTGFFARYSDQHETNLHNTFQGIFKIKTKHIALVVVSVYGILLPRLVAKQNKVLVLFRQLVLPPRFLGIGFILASLLMLDEPTGREEELGELYYSICFVLMMGYYYRVARHTDAFKQ